jgi:hypothetical protein
MPIVEGSTTFGPCGEDLLGRIAIETQSRRYRRAPMAELDKSKTVSLEGLMVSTLAMTDALAKLLIEKGIITDAEFKQKLLE